MLEVDSVESQRLQDELEREVRLQRWQNEFGIADELERDENTALARRF